MLLFRNNNFFLLLIVFFLSFSFYLFHDFVYEILVAGIMVLSTTTSYNYIYNFLSHKHYFLSKHKNLLTSLILTLGFGFLIFFPFIYFMVFSYNNYFPMINKEWLNGIIDSVSHLPPALSAYQAHMDNFLTNMMTTENKEVMIKKVVSVSINFFTNLNGLIMEILLILTFYFLFNLYKKSLANFVSGLIPMKKSFTEYMFNEMSNTSTVVLYGTLFSMFAQGLAFFLFVYIFLDGYSSVYLGVMAGFLSAIPVIGAALVFIPVAINEIMAANYMPAVLLILYSVVFMGFVIDNIFKVIFINNIKNSLKIHYSINEITILFSMLAGISVFGFWGVIIGPSIIAITFASLKIYSEMITKHWQDKES